MTEAPDGHQPLPRVAVIGTGTMGAAMARRLVEAGADVRVWARHPGSTAPLVELRATLLMRVRRMPRQR